MHFPQIHGGLSGKGSPSGRAGERSETERARPLTTNPRHSDSIALTKSLPIAAQRLFRAGLALSVTFGDTSPKGRGFGSPKGAKRPPFGDCSSGRGSFLLGEPMDSFASTFIIFIICDSPQKSSTVRKVYKRPLRRFAPALPEGEPLAGRVTFHWTTEARQDARGRALLTGTAASGQRSLSSCRWPRQRSTAASEILCFARPDKS